MYMSLIKSKQRVVDHGEVLTAEREVNAMLDLVKRETERIESRFLEPACGTGNFLVEILRRKLAVVGARYSSSQLKWERSAVLALNFHLTEKRIGRSRMHHPILALAHRRN